MNNNMKKDYFSKPKGVCMQKNLGNTGLIQVNLGQVAQARVFFELFSFTL
jgi:hypothetical protein